MAEHLARVNDILQESIAAGIPGISAAISTKRGQWLLTAGTSEIQSPWPINARHLFGIGSVTKVFVAVVVLQLLEESKYQLSSTVGNILSPTVLNGIENAREATIESLLGHKAGIDSWEDDPAWIRKGRGSDADQHLWEKTEALGYVRRPRETAPDPGQWYYSNTNYTILGLIIEEVTGKTAEAEIRRRILEPLGMDSTSFEGFEPLDQSRLPSRYHWATETFRDTAGISPRFPEVPGGVLINCTKSNLSVSWVAGGMVSCPSDLVKFASALKQNGKLLAPESRAIMTDWSPTRDVRPEEMGHGLFRMSHGERKDAWLGHFGGVLGFTAGLWWAEKSDCTVCVLSNVGASHAGKVPCSSATTILESDILEIALQLAAE